MLKIYKLTTLLPLSLLTSINYSAVAQDVNQSVSTAQTYPFAKQDVPGIPVAIQRQNYQMIFHDEFDGAAGGKPNPAIWSPRMQGKWRDAWNVEDCARLDGQGHLVITTRRNGNKVETGYISSDGKFEATHGYFECRCQVQKAEGLWSAFWLQSNSLGNPMGDAARAGVEIDVMEYLAYPSHYKDMAMHTAHWDGYTTKHHKMEHLETKVPGLGEGFHTFGVKWDEGGSVFYTDGVETGRWKTAPISCRPEFIILSCEVGPWAGDIAKGLLPDTFKVDWVRAWQTPQQIAADKVREEAKTARDMAKRADEQAAKALKKVNQSSSGNSQDAMAEWNDANQAASAARFAAETAEKAEDEQLKRILGRIDALAKEAKGGEEQAKNKPGVK